jgi:hypothetical protein
MPVDDLRFTSSHVSRPVPRGLSAETTLRHFVTVTYWVDPSALRDHIHPRFEPVCVDGGSAGSRALVSVVTFLDEDFRFVACPWLKNSFGQTNYRAYVLDTVTGKQVAWFFGTCLDSLTVAVPRYVWKLPWHRGRMNFDCRYDESAKRYASFRVVTRSNWAPARLDLRDSGVAPDALDGFADLESALVLLTHPTRGFFFRRDGTLGTYSIWHDRMRPSVGSVSEAHYPLLQQLGLVGLGDRSNVQSVLIQRSVDFTIYLPPMQVTPDAG